MKNQLYKLLFVLLSVMLLSCSKQIEVGPSICPSDSFKFSKDKVVVEGLNGEGKADLAANGLNIKAKFGEKVKWTLSITSASASKEFTGNSDSLNVWWFGNADFLPLFDAGSFKITLKIACLDDMVFDLTNINKPSFKNVKPSYGVLIRDWDKNGTYPVADVMYSGSDGWFGMNGTIDNHYEYFNTDPSPAGGRYAEFYSKNDVPVWYFGGHSFSTPALASHLSTTNADSLYLNIFCKGYGVANTDLEIGVQALGKTYFYTKAIDWTGWKFISIKMSDLIIKQGAYAGNKLESISSVGTFLLQLGSNPLQTAEAKSGYDFVMITVGQPFLK